MFISMFPAEAEMYSVFFFVIFKQSELEPELLLSCD